MLLHPPQWFLIAISFYNTGYIDGVENLEKFENDLRMETNQKFSTIVSHCRASHSNAKKQRYSEEGLFIKLYPYFDMKKGGLIHLHMGTKTKSKE